MHGQRGRGEYHAGASLDMTHLILGTAIVILAVLLLINPRGDRIFFPPVFLLAVLLNAVSGMFKCKTRDRDKKKFRLGILQLVLAVGLDVLGVLSATSIWTQR